MTQTSDTLLRLQDVSKRFGKKKQRLTISASKSLPAGWSGF